MYMSVGEGCRQNEVECMILLGIAVECMIVKENLKECSRVWENAVH